MLLTLDSVYDTTTTTPLRFFTPACTFTLPCRRLLHARLRAPNLYSFLSSSPNKYISQRAFVLTLPTRAAPALTPPTTLAILRRSATVEDTEAAGLDVEIPPRRDAQLILTERAAEVYINFTPMGSTLMTCLLFAQQLRRISSQGQHSRSFLRFSVELGGCHGYQHKMELTRQNVEDWYVLVRHRRFFPATTDREGVPKCVRAPCRASGPCHRRHGISPTLARLHGRFRCRAHRPLFPCRQ